MLSTSERSSASLARSRAARSPAATRTASTSGSNGMRMTSSAPASSASRSTSGEARSAATMTWTAASSGRARTALVNVDACRTPVTTTWAAPSAIVRSASLVAASRRTPSPEAVSSVHAASPSSSRPSTRTLSLARPGRPTRWDGARRHPWPARADQVDPPTRSAGHAPWLRPPYTGRRRRGQGEPAVS